MRRVALGVPVGILKHLHLDAAVEGLPASGDVVGPDEDAGVSFRDEVTPLGFEDEILIHPLGPDFSDGFAGADEVTFLVE